MWEVGARWEAKLGVLDFPSLFVRETPVLLGVLKLKGRDVS